MPRGIWGLSAKTACSGQNAERCWGTGFLAVWQKSPVPCKTRENGSGAVCRKTRSGRKNPLEAMEVEKLKIGTSGEIVAGHQKGLFAENRGELAFLAKPAKDVKS